MRLLVINYEYPPIGAGAATATQQLARQWVHMGHQVTVVTAGLGSLVGHSDEDGIHVVRCASRRRSPSQAGIMDMASYVWHAARNLRVLLRQESFDAVICFFSLPCGPLAWWLKKRYQLEYVIALRGGDVPGNEKGLGLLHWLLTPIRRLILKNARRVVANSQGLKNQSEKVDPINVDVIHNGVDASFYTPEEGQKGKGPFQFLFVGRFQAQKNLAEVLTAINLLPEGCRLVCVGDGPLRSEWQHLARSLGLGERVVWVPWCDREALLDWYRQSDCLLNYALYEGLPNVVLEAMACGLPVILSDIPGHQPLVSAKYASFLVKLGDVETLAARCSHMIGDIKMARAFGGDNRRRVQEFFQWHVAAQRFVLLFEQD